MKFNDEYFDMGLNRLDTRSEKWDLLRQRQGEDVLPLWVADMDFPSPPAVQTALLQRAAHPTYGYTEPLDDDWQAPIDFWQRRHGLSLQKEDLIMLPCVITGIKNSLLASTAPGDKVIILSPVYGPFRFSVQATGRTLADCPLLRDEAGRYTIDFDAVESAMRGGAKALILCSPHNPVGRLWTREELTRLCGLCDRYGITLISDEIHADFVLDGAAFTPILSLRTEKTVSLCAASKTFNLAGLQQALALCKDPALRESISKVMEAEGVKSGNLFALEGTRAAYNEGDAWLDGLLHYLQGNRDCLKEQVAELLPRAVLTPLEATYLCWLDLRAWGFGNQELMDRCRKAGVAFTEGTFFGDNGDGFLRVNIACPRRYLREGMLRLKKALEEN